jgi:hypothetical protein
MPVKQVGFGRREQRFACGDWGCETGCSVAEEPMICMTCMGLFLSSSFFGYYQFLVRSEETRSSPRRLRSGSLERAEGGKGPKH